VFAGLTLNRAVTILSDTTVTGFGDISGYNPAPLTLYARVTNLGRAEKHDPSTQGRYFDVGWIAPFFFLDPFSDGGENFLFDAVFLQWINNIIQWTSRFPGGLDGFHYDLGPGVQVRFMLTDDP